MLSEDLNEQFHIALAVQAAEEIGIMVPKSPECSYGYARRNQRWNLTIINRERAG